tara:strand:- start:1279 stop:5268 length:3990 start_codon:yes stop_codon:yes gene_type:complete
MLNVSQNFKNDIISTNQTLKPVLVITDSDNNVLFTLTQDKDELFDIDGNMVRTINGISRVSNVKISTDYDSKKLKINRLRCTLYNYYDVNTKLSEYINTNVISKNLYLFYKSPSTNVIDITNQLNKSDCALIYNGEISRITFNDSTIELSIEDKTQIKIVDKSVPYMSVDKIPQSIKERVLDEYVDDDITIPMTFGKVDKAPVYPYETEYSNRTLDVLFDIHPTASHFKTFKIPSVSKLNLPIDNDFYLYIKSKKDYIIWNHGSSSYNYQPSFYSKVKIVSDLESSEDFIVPELQDLKEGFNLWNVNGLVQRQVLDVYAGDGSVLDINNLTIDDYSENIFQNIDKINDNAQFIKKWYRDSDDISSYQLNWQNAFDTGIRSYNNTDYNRGAGRWILLKLDKGFDNELRNIQLDGQYAGNTFLAADYQVYQSNDNSTPNTVFDSLGFFVSPISTEIWKVLLKDLINTNESENKWRKIINALILTTQEDLENAFAHHNNLLNLHSTTANPFENCAIHLDSTLATDTKFQYFGSNTILDLKKINGLFYGDRGNDNRLLIPESSNEHSYIAIYEFYSNEHYNLNNNLTQGLRADNIGFLQTVDIPNVIEEEIYASIIGRKNNYYTEQIEAEPQAIEQIDYSLNEIILGPNSTMPDFDILTNNIYQLILETPLNEFLDTESYNFGFQFDVSSLEEIFNNNINNVIDDSAMYSHFYLFKYTVFAVYRKNVEMWNYLHTLNGITEIVREEGFYDVSLQSLKSESYIKSICKRVYEYLYQTEINYDYNWSITHINPNWTSTDPPNWIQYVPYFYSSEITFDSTSLDVEFEYNIDSFVINNKNDFINEIGVYLDDTVEAINIATYNMLIPHLFKPFWWSLGSGTNIQYFATGYTSHGGGNLESFRYTFTNDENLSYSIYRLQEELVYATYLLNTVGQSANTEGIIEKPSDIIMNILTFEMGYGRRIENQLVENNDAIAPNYNKFDIDSIIESREAHNWKMGFSVSKKREGKTLIEDILKETKSFPRFSSDGKFGLLTIKESYEYSDINTIIKLDDVLSYKFEQTKREDIITSVKMFYRFDYGQDEFTFDLKKSIDDIFPDWTTTGYDNYNIVPVDGHKDIELKYHTDTPTVEDFANYTLMNNCNPHNMVSMKLPLNYMDLSVGDKIHIPLINNEKIFNVDYSKVDFVNGQPIYPLWIIMETNIATDSINIKAYQLHYLGTDGNHGFELPNQEYQVFGNINEFSNWSFSNEENVLNWNYNPNANIHNDFEIPYFDLNGDGEIDILDIIMVINHIIGGDQLTNSQKQRLKYNYDGSLQNNYNKNTINIIDLVNLVNMAFVN